MRWAEIKRGMVWERLKARLATGGVVFPAEAALAGDFHAHELACSSALPPRPLERAPYELVGVDMAVHGTDRTAWICTCGRDSLGEPQPCALDGCPAPMGAA